MVMIMAAAVTITTIARVVLRVAGRDERADRISHSNNERENGAVTTLVLWKTCQNVALRTSHCSRLRSAAWSHSTTAHCS